MQCLATSMLLMKSISQIISPPSGPHWVGNGFRVYPVFNNLAFTSAVSPFLMFDYAAPKHFEATNERRGVGEHPHRGFETVSIAFQGSVQHHDNQGNTGIIGPGDVQWMTAGKGIIHEEYLAPNFLKKGGTVEFAQLWVNLPAKYKLTPPKYQPILKEDIKTVQMNDDSGSIRIIAGSFDKVQGPATTFTPIDVWDISIKKLMKFSIPEEKTTIIFVRKGSVKICGERVIQSPNIVLLSSKGEGITLEPMTEDETFVLLLSGDPINEPIAARGPFVMNTEKEIYQAMSDFQSGKF